MKVSSIKNASSWFVLSYDTASVIAAWVFSCIAVLGPLFALKTPWTLVDMGLMLVTQVLCFRHFRTYRPMWKFTSFGDIHRILKSTFIGCLFGFITIFFMNQFNHTSPTLLILYPFLFVALTCSGRLMVRYFHERSSRGVRSTRVLLIGAGKAAELFLRDSESSKESSYDVVALLDDDSKLLGKEIAGKRVLGSLTLLRAVSEKIHFNMVVIALPSASGERVKEVVEQCEAIGKPVKTLPSLLHLASGKVTVSTLRDVSIEDLLKRDELKLNDAELNHFVLGKTILVTGGGGSIGSEILRQLLAYNPANLVVVDNGEYNLYSVEQELLAQKQATNIDFHLCDVKDLGSLHGLFEYYKPDLVYHAAAYKHVPLLEHQVEAAFMNNVVGTVNVAKVAIAHNVKNFVLISTDKAVNPSSVMGATKRIAEILCQRLDQDSDTNFIAVRFGNVLGSHGSVVPLFKRQLANGGPLTVTHPDIERYFMTIPEACQLVLQASTMGEGSDIFVLDMGKPIKIVQLAEQLIRLSGKEPYKDIDIKFTGLREGEKLYEELSYAGEKFVPTKFKSINRIAEFSNDFPTKFVKLNELLQIYELEFADRVRVDV